MNLSSVPAYKSQKVCENMKSAASPQAEIWTRTLNCRKEKESLVFWMCILEKDPVMTLVDSNGQYTHARLIIIDSWHIKVIPIFEKQSKACSLNLRMCWLLVMWFSFRVLHGEQKLKCGGIWSVHFNALFNHSVLWQFYDFSC